MSDTIQYSSDARMLPKPIQGRCFYGEPSSRELPSWVSRLQSLSLPPHASWKAFKVCEAGGLCSKPWDCLQLATSPSLPAPFLLLPETASPLAVETSSNTDWTVIQTSIFPYWPDETAGKALTKYWVGQTVNKQFGQLKNSPFSIIRTHTRKQGHGTKLVFNQLAVTPQTFCFWMAVFYWQSRILSNISVHTTQPVLSQTFHWTSFSFLQLLRVKEGSWKHLSQECCVSYK